MALGRLRATALDTYSGVGWATILFLAQFTCLCYRKDKPSLSGWGCLPALQKIHPETTVQLSIRTLREAEVGEVVGFTQLPVVRPRAGQFSATTPGVF